jgi:hypothetical protein
MNKMASKKVETFFTWVAIAGGLIVIILVIAILVKGE